MKVALFIDWGSNNLSKELKKELDKYPFPQCRVNIVDFIKKHGNSISEVDNVYEINNSFYCIKDVDIDRPWRITDYDGKEWVQYLDYEVIDKDLNYCELREE